MNCNAIFSDTVFLLRGHEEEVAPKQIPEGLVSMYTLDDRIKIQDFYWNERYHGGTAMLHVWSAELVEEMVKNASLGILDGNYGSSETNHLRSALKFASTSFKDGRVLVIGSENPWVEACVLEAGAHRIVTLEYGTIKSEHPAIDTMTPHLFKQRYENGSIGTFDAIVSFSSVEHAGLGRYGDALNPWGDVLEIARAHCVCKEGGSLVLAVMDGDVDKLFFNAHRVYGPIRWPYLTTNWQQVQREPYQDGSQRVHVFRKISHQG